MVLVGECESLFCLENTRFPREVEFIISAMEAGPKPVLDRHKQRRIPYRVRATLSLFSDAPEQSPCLLYTRHVHSKALGFLTSRHLPLSHGGVVQLPLPNGTVLNVGCTVLRCREAAPGWYEGAVYFNREQAAFNNLPM